MQKNEAYPKVPGKLKNYRLTPTGISGQTENSIFQIQVYADNTFRIQVSLKKTFQPNPYSVVAEANENAYSFEDQDKFLFLKTTKIHLSVSKENFSLTFKNPSGQVISEDDPNYGIHWLGTEVSNYKKLQEWEKFIGLGEKTGGLNRYGQTYTHWNTDHFAYGTGDDPLYLSIPFFMGLHHGLSYGIFFDNTHKTTFNFGAGNNRYAYYSAEDGDLDYYFFHDQNIADIITAFSYLTGKPELPQKWALGYQQCRYSYYPDKDVIRLAQTFRDKGIPADVIYLDIHHMEKYKVFTFDGNNFPDPSSMISYLKKSGFKVVVILDPGIKVDEDYTPYLEGKSKNLFLKYPDGEIYQGQVWPGWCAFPDFTLAQTRDWWAEKLKFYTDLGVDGFWTDMNEPATWGQTIPNLVQFDFEGVGGNHKKSRNVYGLQMARSTSEGQQKQHPESRPFVLTRSGFAGVQRHAAVWTGDNVSNDEHMLAGIRLVNSLGLSGVPFSGYDIGGFVGNCSPELFARWISIAAFCPFFRAHTMINSHASEPWSFGEEVEGIARNYIRLRYKLMPLIYTAFYQSSQNGLPVAKSLALVYPFDDKVYHGAYENQYLFCDSLLIAPVESYKIITKIYLPEGDWYHFFSDKKTRGGQEVFWDCPLDYLPVFVAAGSILLMQSAIQYVDDMHDGRLKIHVYKGKGLQSQDLYEDDGKSRQYLNGKFSKRTIRMDHDHGVLTIGAATGEFTSSFKKTKIYFHGFSEQVAIVRGQEQKMQANNIAFLDEISEFDPLPVGEHAFQICKSVPAITIDLDTQEQLIQLR
ncbi:glycoside hydrolase family 31 protein [Cyclobacterium plantarum]|uniref:Glycoside hydrolase family 31 protein n=1 Tax=Cyclobacterium plantarum TaxID=2716263 RepID=A0ABX0H8G9_9BACT|nr:glycoside hydrolase family 31 protein [Cyclobacterium plantarum]NHE56717.1 glycoside hydrolase family 31 protein [Cyclobacterium plantarum]